MLSETEGSNTQRFLIGAAILAEFTPLFLGHHWQDVFNRQEKYKKKIYGPVTGVVPVKIGDDILPALSMSLFF